MVKSLKRLSLIDVFCLGLNAIIGSGIFLFPGKLAALAGPASIAAFLLCGLLLSAVALCYAELGAMLKGNGGSYLYAREAFGEQVGYGVGVVAWAAALLSWAAVASILAAHLAYFHPWFDILWVRKAVAALGLALFGLINYRGIKPGAWTVDILTGAKLIPLALLVLLGLPQIDLGRLGLSLSGDAAIYGSFYQGSLPFGYAVFLALWALQGFEVAPVPAGETENPQRDLPRAVLGSLLFASLFYALIQFVVVTAFPGLSSSHERPLVDAAAHFAGSWGGGLLAVGGIISMLGFIAGAALGSPRYLSAIGERQLGAWRLATVHRRFATPHRAIVATTGSAIALILLFDFSKLIDLSNLAVVSQYLASCLALLALRYNRPNLRRPYRMPWAWGIAPIGAAVSLWLMTQVSKTEVIGSLILLGAAYILRRVFRGRA
jgi:amino acid transporter